MELYVVTWKSEKLQEGKKKFVVRDAFDDKDAINKVRKRIDKAWLGGESFTVNRVVFVDDLCAL